jgi:hypothetical protein
MSMKHTFVKYASSYVPVHHLPSEKQLTRFEACLFTEGVASLTFFSKAFRDRFYQKVRSSARKLSAQLGNDEDSSSRLFRTFTTRSGRPSTTRSRREHGSDTALDDIPKVPERVYTFSGYFRDDRDYETV